jgi:hypothetical protein
MQLKTSDLKQESSEKYDMVDSYDDKGRGGDDLSSLRFTDTRGSLLTSHVLPTSEIILGNTKETFDRIEFS